MEDNDEFVFHRVCLLMSDFIHSVHATSAAALISPHIEKREN